MSFTRMSAVVVGVAALVLAAGPAALASEDGDAACDLDLLVLRIPMESGTSMNFNGKTLKCQDGRFVES